MRRLKCYFLFWQVPSGSAVSGGMGGPHGMPRSVPRPIPVVGMARIQPQGMAAYNLASQAGMGSGLNPGTIPVQRGVANQAHPQQQVSEMNTRYFPNCGGSVPLWFSFFIIWLQLRRKDPGMGMTGYPPQQKSRRFWGDTSFKLLKIDEWKSCVPLFRLR